jgi:hypothetical protein
MNIFFGFILSATLNTMYTMQMKLKFIQVMVLLESMYLVLCDSFRSSNFNTCSVSVRRLSWSLTLIQILISWCTSLLQGTWKRTIQACKNNEGVISQYCMLGRKWRRNLGLCRPCRKHGICTIFNTKNWLVLINALSLGRYSPALHCGGPDCMLWQIGEIGGGQVSPW